MSRRKSAKERFIADFIAEVKSPALKKRRVAANLWNHDWLVARIWKRADAAKRLRGKR